RGSAPQAAKLAAAIERDYLSPAVPQPLAWEFRRYAMKLMQGAIGAEQAGVKRGAIGNVTGQLRAAARSLPPTSEQVTVLAEHGAVLKILDQAHWAAGWLHHLTAAQPHPVCQDDLAEAAALVAKLTEDAAALAAQQEWRTADTTGILTHAITELPRRARSN